MIQAERYTLSELLDSSARMAALAERVVAGALFVYPTETIYGLGGRADRATVRRRLVEAKARGKEQPLILVAGNREAFSFSGVEFPDAAERLAVRLWPGRLTLVLPTPAQGGTLGVRVSDHPFIQALTPHFSLPLFSTSANLSGTPYVGEPDTIFRIFAASTDFMIDAGVLPPSEPSTVVRVDRASRVEILREGAVSAAAVSAAADGPR